MLDFNDDLRNDVAKADEFLGAVEAGKWMVDRNRVAAGTENLQPDGCDAAEFRSEPDLERLRLSRRLLLNLARNLGVLDDLPIELRSSQLFAIKDLVNFLKNLGVGQLLGYLRQATGAGKTVLFGILAILLDVKTLILVPSITLLYQTKTEFMEALGISENDIGIVGDSLFETGKKVTIATYASHRNMLFGTWDRDAQYRDTVAKCPFWVCDEGHRGLGELTAQSIEGVGRVRGDRAEGDEELDGEQEEEDEVRAEDLNDPRFANILKLAFTATPKLQRKSVEDLFKTLVSEIGMDQLVNSNILVPYRVIDIEANVDAAEIKGVDISARKEFEILERERIFEKLLQQFLEHRDKIAAETGEVLKTAVFCRTINHCDAFLKVAMEMGFDGMVVTSRETRKFGDEILREAEQRLLDGEIDFIITVNKLAEGWNFPPLNAALLARAILSPAVMVQACGRACRSFKGKRFSYIFEPDWQVTRESFAGDPKTFGNRVPPVPEEIGRNTGGGKGKPHLAKAKKPLRLVDALSLMGENVSTVCRGYDEKLLRVDAEYQMPVDGVLKIVHPQTGEMVEVICIYPYLASHYPACPEKRTVKFLQSKLSPVDGVSVSRGKVPIMVYLRSAADELLSGIVRSERASSQSIDGKVEHTRRIPLKLMAFEDDGSLILSDSETEEPIVVVNLYIYAKYLDLGYKIVRQHVNGRGVAPVKVGEGVLAPGVGDTDLFLKEEVDKAVPAEDDGKLICRIWDWAKNEWTEGVSMVRYFRHLKIGQRTQAAVFKNLEPVGHVLVGERHFSMDVYRKDEVDVKIAAVLKLDVDGIARLKARSSVETAAPAKRESISNKLDGNGVCSLRHPPESDEMIEVVGLAAYSGGADIDVEVKTLQRYVAEAGLTPVCKVMSGTVVVEAFLRAAVDAAIIAARGHLKMKKLGANGVGFVEFPTGSGQQVEVVSVQGYGSNIANFRYTGVALRAAVLASSLKPLPGIKMRAGKRGNAIVDVYRRDEVDAFIKRRWGIDV